jgi:prolyl-tRNA editing enzyme YbaK/EbsC (Cys-tRNA(Pro) deacylase)
MPPFGNPYGVDVYVNQTLSDDATIVMRAGTHKHT